MAEASLQIVGAEMSDKDGIRYWRVTWNDRSGGDGFLSLYVDSDYQEKIAPRLHEMWTMQQVLALEE